MDSITATVTIKPRIVGTMGVVEQHDSIKTTGGIGTLGEMFTLGLLRRDAILWRQRRYSMSAMSEDDSEEPDYLRTLEKRERWSDH